jgi:hypothetical protein
MSTIYNALKNNFTQVSNHALLDVRLSSKAYKLYAYMCFRISIFEKWEFNEPEILKHFKEKRDAMRDAKNELIDCGYLVKIQNRTDKGFFRKNDYQIFAEPQAVESNPSPENPSTDKPAVEKPSAEKASYNNKDKINKDLTNKELLSLPLEKKREILQKIWKEKNLKSDCEKYLLFREKTNWKGVSNLDADVAWWENGHKEKYPELHREKTSTGHVLSPVETPEIAEIRSTIKFMVGQEDRDDCQLFAGKIEKDGEGFKIFVASEKALRYAEVLGQINLRIEVK